MVAHKIGDYDPNFTPFPTLRNRVSWLNLGEGIEMLPETWFLVSQESVGSTEIAFKKNESHIYANPRH